jgi:transcriptional regulator with XRE-family HTH domain
MNGEMFWKIVKREVDRQNTSYEWLYRKTGIPKGTFSSWKNRNIIPRADAACRIAAALGVSVEYLLTGTDKPGEASNPRMGEIIKNLVLLDDLDREAVEALTRTLAKRRKA